MKNMIRLLRKKNSGQGMVEFALVLPMLLLVSLGIIELGRLMLVYSSVMAASREAARYASAAGFAYGNVPYYLDTAGIEAAARRIAVMTGGTVNISWDEGPNTSPFTPSEPSDVDLGDRVVIQVSTMFNPLLGVTPLKPFSINATTSRTILKEVSISGNPPTTSDFTVLITSPVLTSFETGESITFAAMAQNASGSVSYSWSSSIDGAFGSSDAFSTSTLSAGTHVITLLGTDEDGDTDTAQITITIQGRPEVVIAFPLENSLHQEGIDIFFSGSAQDDEDGNLSASLVWTRGGGIVIGTGASFAAQLPAGPHLITATVTDSSGLSGSDSVNIMVEAQELPPSVVIDAPVENASFQEETDITFSGSASDLSDGSISDRLVWKLSDGTVIGNGSSFTAQLPAGTHTITAEATDNAGLTGQDTVTILVVSGEAPQIVIVAPQDNSFFNLGDTITFVAEATDPDGVLGGGDLTLYWFIDDGGDPVHSGTSFTISTLAVGAHTIRAQVIDSDENTAWDSVNLTIAQNTAPVVTIVTPNDGASFIEGQPVIFIGSASDAEDNDLSDSIEWTSSLMPGGTIGAGSTFTLTNLVVGVHTITASVSDLGVPPLTGADTISLEIRPDPCRIQPVPATKIKKKVTWEFINNGSASYTLVTFTLPWSDGQNNQSLEYVQFGLLESPATLWHGTDSTNGSTFGSGTVGYEFSWNPSAPNFTFEAGPSRSEKIISGFQLDIDSVPGVMIAVFRNDQTGDLCTYTYSFMQ